MVFPTRKFIAVLNFDQDVASRYDETNGYEETAPVEFLEREFGWMEQSGVYLENCALVDDDSYWGRYVTYLVRWAIDHGGANYEGKTPISFAEWRDCEDGK